jgi:hypothetical protein
MKAKQALHGQASFTRLVAPGLKKVLPGRSNEDRIFLRPRLTDRVLPQIAFRYSIQALLRILRMTVRHETFMT